MAIHWPSVIDRIPSLVVELGSGVFLVAVLTFGLLSAHAHPFLTVFALGTAASLIYEGTLDANPFSLKDVAQREAGIVAGLLLVALFKVL